MNYGYRSKYLQPLFGVTDPFDNLMKMMDPLPRKKMHIVNFANNFRAITHLLKPKLKDLALDNSIEKFLIKLIKLITSYWLKTYLELLLHGGPD